MTEQCTNRLKIRNRKKMNKICSCEQPDLGELQQNFVDIKLIHWLFYFYDGSQVVIMFFGSKARFEYVWDLYIHILLKSLFHKHNLQCIFAIQFNYRFERRCRSVPKNNSDLKLNCFLSFSYWMVSFPLFFEWVKFGNFLCSMTGKGTPKQTAPFLISVS